MDSVTREAALLCVGAGWASLINQAYDFFETREVQVHQVKEKFGGLRIYVDAPRYDEAHAFIAALERASIETCEHCGAPGTSTTDHRWMLTLCADCKLLRGRT